MIPSKIVERGLHMEHSQMRLGLVIALIITVNSVMLLSSVAGSGRYLIASLAFFFALVSEYFLARQWLERSMGTINILQQLGARERSITASILGRFLLVGLIGIVAGFLIGISATVAFQALSLAATLQDVLVPAFIGHVLIVGLAGIGGITIGSYLGITSTLQLQTQPLRT